MNTGDKGGDAMSSRYGVLCQKIVTASEVDLGKIKLPALTEELKQIIRDAKLKSLEGLLGPDSEKVLRKLVEQYWR